MRKEYYTKNRDRILLQKKEYYVKNMDILKEKSSKQRVSLGKERIRSYNSIYYKENIDDIKEGKKKYQQTNKEAIAKRKREYYLKHRDMIIEKAMNYEKKNRLKVKEVKRRYRENNKASLRIKRLGYGTNRKKVDIQFKLQCAVRDRLNKALKGNQKSGSAIKDLGCTVEELKTHLETQFQEGMSWSNWARDGWHIDHRIPLSSFDLTDREQLLKAVNYTNLQPLWALENIIKSNKIL